MKTLDYIAENYHSKTLGGRDYDRLMRFIPESRLKDFGIELKKEYTGTHEHIPFTRDNVLKQLERDVIFGFEKCMNRRGISSAMMYEVVKMWNWILEEGLEDFEDEGLYGRDTFEATAEKYGFDIKY